MHDSRLRLFPEKTVFLTVAFVLFVGVEAKAQCLTANEQPNPFPASALKTVNVAFALTAACGATSIRVQVVSDSGGAVLSDPINEDPASHDYFLSINLFSGNNTIRVFGINGGALVPAQQWAVSCTHAKCNAALALGPASVAGASGAPPLGAGGPGAPTSKITIDNPTVPSGATAYPATKSEVDSYVTVKKDSGIVKIQYDVIHNDKVAFTSEPINVNPVAGQDKQLSVTLRVLRGSNTIRIYDVAHPGGGNDATLPIDCTGENCVPDFDVATIVTNSQNTRVVIGLEQAGGSSAESKTKPFLDFFFTTPFLFDKEKDGVKGAPRAGFWGQVRLTSTPEQLTTTGVFPSTLANQVAQSGTTANLVQSFDYLAGMEARLRTANGTFLSLIPVIPQKTRFYLAGGFGAVSPLDATKENTQFFVLPPETSPMRALFEQRYGKPPKVKNDMGQMVDPTYVAFVPLERDRFFRQWYAGIRLKTHYCVDDDCKEFRNSFPAITDFMIGQSQSVTGGTFKRTTKEGKTRQSFVFRVDAFYPLPFRDTRFIYLYGTAIIKLFGDVRVDSALLLEPATSIPGINSPMVYVPPVEFLRGQQPNRDYYKIGVGINLTDFFNRNKPRP